MIRIAATNRASVKDDFKELAVSVARQQVEEVKRQAERNPRLRTTILKQNASLLRNATALLKDMDGVTTKLRLLNGYTAFDTFRYQNKDYFHAHTKPVGLNNGGKSLISVEGRRGLVEVDDPPCWDMGEYDVYVPADIFAVRNLNHFHFVPERAPLDGHRHPHHHARYIRPGDNGEDWNIWSVAHYVDPRAGHPLDMFAKTCWGGFNTIIANNLSEMDVIEMFRTIWVYLNRHNPGSPLVYMDDISFKRPL
jgi:hypothetical protein